MVVIAYLNKIARGAMMEVMKGLIALGVCIVEVLSALISADLARATDVTQFHNHATRDGLFIDPAFTPAAASALKRDLSFDGRVSGHVYAQPLYIENGPAGRALIIVATESDTVYALDAANGTVLWEQSVGVPVPLSKLPCGDIDPLGVTGTPIVDLPSRTMFFDAMTTPDGGTTKKHLIYALDVDTGLLKTGWPVDVDATARSGTIVFTSVTQNQRSALALLGGYLYVAYGGHDGDCGTYHGWIIGMPINNPSNVMAWATPAVGGGSWSVGGIASDGVDPFIATGNTFRASKWSGGEAIIRFQPGPVFSGLTNDYWAPVNWPTLDSTDRDIGGSGPLIVDVPGATPSALVVSFGKDGNAYVLDRTNLGGVQYPLWEASVSSTAIIQAAATYQTTQGVYVVFAGNGNQLTTFRLAAANPPKIINAWSASENGHGSPFVTSTDGIHNAIVWGLGAESDQRLHAFNGETGAVLYSGGGSNELMTATHRYSTGIAAHGRIYIATDNKVYAFTVPASPIVLTDLSFSATGGLAFAFNNVAFLHFTAYGSTNISLPLKDWTNLGSIPEISPGVYQFADPAGTASGSRFYQVTSP